MAAEIEEVEEMAGPSDGHAQNQENTVEDNRRLRKDYRDFAKNAERETEALVDLRTGKLVKSITNLNKLHIKVKGAREQAEDTACFYLLCQKAAEAAKRVIGPGKNRTAGRFLRALKAAHVSSGDAQADGEADPAAFNWAALARDVAKHFKAAPGLACVLGPMSAAPKVRKAPAPRQPKKELGRLEAPEEVEVPEDEKKDPAVKNMEDMHAALLQRPGHCANVLACTVNHASFSQSVENFFALSFLVKDHKVVLTKDPAGGFRVRALTDAQQEEMGKIAPPRTQAIFGFDMAAWEEWKRRVRPADTLMPHRPPFEFPGGAAAGLAQLQASPQRTGNKRKSARQQVQDSEEEEEEEEDAAAAAARARKGKRKVTS